MHRQRLTILLLLLLLSALPAAAGEQWVDPIPVPAIDPVLQAPRHPYPPGFDGWVTVHLNGQPLIAPYDPLRGVAEPAAFRAAPSGRVMMPVRFFTEAFGGRVDWDHEGREARLWLKGRHVVFTIGQGEALVDGEPVRLEEPPLLYRERTFVPLRALMEALGGQVEWHGFSRSARVKIPGLRCISRQYCGEVRTQ